MTKVIKGMMIVFEDTDTVHIKNENIKIVYTGAITEKISGASNSGIIKTKRMDSFYTEIDSGANVAYKPFSEETYDGMIFERILRNDIAGAVFIYEDEKGTDEIEYEYIYVPWGSDGCINSYCSSHIGLSGKMYILVDREYSLVDFMKENELNTCDIL